MFSDEEYQSASSELSIPVERIKAVAEVESSGENFWNINGVNKPAVRHEAHWFGKFTKYIYNNSHPEISSSSWNPQLAAGTRLGAWKQHEEALALDANAAYKSASWGPFQLMGFHWDSLGYDSPKAMVDAMYTTKGQLESFVKFIKVNPTIWRALQTEDYETFELHYNGGGYGGAYASKIRAAVSRNLFGKNTGNSATSGHPVIKLGSQGEDVKEVQKKLGLNPDGFFGPQTHMAVYLYQLDHGLEADGVVGPITLATLMHVQHS